MDERNFDASMRVFFQIHVVLEVTKPLCKGMKLKKDNGEWAMVEFRYEQLPTFYFLCEIIRHCEKFCGKALHLRDPEAKKHFGA